MQRIFTAAFVFPAARMVSALAGDIEYVDSAALPSNNIRLL